MNAGGLSGLPTLNGRDSPRAPRPHSSRVSSGGAAVSARDAGDGGGFPGDTEARAVLPAYRSIPLVSLLSPLPASQRRVCLFRGGSRLLKLLSPCRDDSYGAGPHDGQKNWRSAEAALVVRSLARFGVAHSLSFLSWGALVLRLVDG
jgi:hypothetical protein